MKKRILTVLLAVCLVLALGTVTALADGSAVKTGTSVALVDGLYYDSLADAVAAIETEGTIDLVANVTITKGNDSLVIPAEKTVTLNLHTYTIKSNDVLGTMGAINNKGTLTINAEDGGKIDASSLYMSMHAVYNTGTMTINSGEIVGRERTVTTANSGTTTINGGTLYGGKIAVFADDNSKVTITGDAQVKGGTTGVYADTGSVVVISGDAQVLDAECAVRAYGGNVTVQDNASLTGQFGILLYNLPNNNTEDVVNSSLTMTGGTVTVTGGFALSGNNLQSAGCSANITGGTLTSVDETGIYWPMEGKLTIGGSAVVEGATGIQARMGEINISGNAVIKGTGDYSETAPESGEAAAEGSALLVSAQMYGASEGQYAGSPNITVNITGGTLQSSQGNAVTVYNTETTEEQEADVSVTGGEFSAAEGKAAVQVTTVNGKNTSELKQESGKTVLTTSKSTTTVTVSADAAVAAVDQDGKTYYYTDADDAMQVSTDSEDKTSIYIMDDVTVSGAIGENTTIITPEDVDITVYSDVSGKVVKEETDSSGNKTYVLVDESTVALAPPAVTLTADSKSAFVGSTITLTAAASHSDTGVTLAYQWYMNGQLIAGASDATLKVTEGGTYEVVVIASKDNGGVTYHSNASASVTCSFREPTIPTPHEITIANTANGTVDTSLSNASAGAVITITATPNSGYGVSGVAVTGPDGAVTVTRVDANTYTFVMPDGPVTVSVTFGNGLPFTDVSAGQWFYDYVSYVYFNGLMDGTSSTTFEPNANMTRAMVWAILARIDGETVTGESWQTDARAWAMANGVSDGSDPNGLVTREQFATMLWRYAGEPASTYSLSAFSDAGSVTDWAETAMAWAVEHGIITGMTDTTLVPQGSATRAQCAAMLMRFVELG